ncbi:uncharacterized protein SPSK_09479 [Sporothrix schenckii 1099-18]|uniref:Mediator of RNA polymerase II transcription subunit 18 n=2 Tax=Sporothrix schenckii TaxID=29908 RepID=U7Q8B7_SPOS1|nr:uncharacterized protein SPSK_09479 [Sporothrix schenckii 1099-18]ERT03310.1 hypothetical protein HMPREF1624_01621 [Sporothrix schenckii ATCC 58251]KJR84254.1 hypothetical protein SPSK_09479 [Sporothrix schenckii 1099-18]
MHELFLTAVVPDTDIERAKALLQGLSGMTARGTVHRILYFAGPPQPRGLAVKRAIPQPIQPAQGRLWTELHQQMVRQSFVLQARYPVNRDELGAAPGPATSPGAAAILSGAAQGTLRWTDIPDPTGGSSATGITRLVTQRKKVELPETRNLPAILTDNGYRFKSELIEESFIFYSNGNEYVLARYHRLPSAAPAAPGTPLTPLAALPSWDQITNSAGVDPSRQWLFFVRRHVVDDTSPDKMKKALEALEAARAQLTGIFAFVPVDRRAHDTRIERPAGGGNVGLPGAQAQKLRT